MCAAPLTASAFQIKEGRLFRDETLLAIEHLTFHRRIASGKNGLVFESTQTHLNRRVAVKIRFKSISDKASRAIYEAQKLARLGHPLLVSLYEFGIAEKWPFAIMELVQGQTLHDWLAHPQSMRDRYLIWKLYSAALDYIYRAGMVHGDPHTKNVLIYPDKLQICRVYMPPNIEEYPAFGLKLADVGTSRIWRQTHEFAKRESKIILETLGRILSHAPIERYANFPESLSPADTLAACDRFAEFATFFEQITRFHRDDEEKAWDLHIPFLQCPFIDIDKFIEFARTHIPESSVFWALQRIYWDMAWAVGMHSEAAQIKSPVGHSLSDDELQIVRKIQNAYRTEYIKDPKLTYERTIDDDP